MVIVTYLHQSSYKKIRSVCNQHVLHVKQEVAKFSWDVGNYYLLGITCPHALQKCCDREDFSCGLRIKTEIFLTLYGANFNQNVRLPAGSAVHPA